MIASLFGTAETHFDPATHEYRIAGRLVPHVTQIIAGLSSYVGVPSEVLARKRDIGRAVHLATAYLDSDDLDHDSVPAEISGYVCAYRTFLGHTGFRPEAIERHVYSARYGYAGTLDRVGTFSSLRRIRPSAPCLVDLKATYTIAPAVGPQTAAYAQAWHEQTGEKIKHRFALQLRADGSYSLLECTDDYDLSVFLAALTLKNWRVRHLGEAHENED